MKVKIKLTIEQFAYLVQFVRVKLNTLNKLNLVNANLFVNAGLKRCIDLTNEARLRPHKEKTFAIELNQFAEIVNLLQNEFDNLDPYTLSIYTSISRQPAFLLIEN